MVLERFFTHDFQRFYISVNYKAGIIEKYLGEGNDWNVGITYAHAEKMARYGRAALNAP